MSQQSEELKRRTAEFARRVIGLCGTVPPTQAGIRLTGQLIDAATSVAGNYRAACRARSRAEFTAKIGVVAEEADECVGWLELMVSVKLLSAESARWELDEARELAAIFAASFRTARSHR
ncbi:MAG: four helix bundle protein [Acidobacteria bacterium]|nr:four helix bundle protein [Acidobacteriota bacterium]